MPGPGWGDRRTPGTIMGEPGEGPSVAEETTLDAFVTDERSQQIQPTMVWRPDGATCPACGMTVTRLWRAADRLVCPACKRWTEE